MNAFYLFVVMIKIDDLGNELGLSAPARYPSDSPEMQID
jgi:hypothetical protein